MHIGVSAVTGDLTVAVGFADGDTVGGDGDALEVAGDVVKVGVKYVTGDLTFNVGFASGTAKDGTKGTAGTTDDSKDSTCKYFICCAWCNRTWVILMLIQQMKVL